MIGTGKFKQFLSIPEAALVWAGLPLELLADAAYPAPAVPLLVGHPDVTPMAEALIEATSRGTLIDCSRADPDMPLPPPERRTVSRRALMAWIDENWPDTKQQPGRPVVSPQCDSPYPAAPAASDQVADERLLTLAEVQEMLGGISRSTVHRLRTAGELPGPTHTGPLRWPLSVIRTYIAKNPNPSAEPEDI